MLFSLFCFFFFFLFLFSNITKKKNKKCNFLFENLIFDNPKFCKNTILTLFVLQKKPKNTIKLGKNSKQNLDQFLTYSLDQFLTYKTPNLGPIFDFTAYIMCIYNFTCSNARCARSPASVLCSCLFFLAHSVPVTERVWARQLRLCGK